MDKRNHCFRTNSTYSIRYTPPEGLPTSLTRLPSLLLLSVHLSPNEQSCFRQQDRSERVPLISKQGLSPSRCRKCWVIFSELDGSPQGTVPREQFAPILTCLVLRPYDLVCKGRASGSALIWQRPASCPPWLMSPATPRYACGP